MRKKRLFEHVHPVLLVLALAAPAGADIIDVAVLPSNQFDPDVVNVSVGDTVRWTNAGGTHNVVADGGAFSSGAPSSGAWTFSHTFDGSGSFPYHCGVHGGAGGLGMSGTVNVAGGGGGTPGSLRFSNASYSVSEGAANATITVQRVGGDDGAVSVDYATANGSGQAGSDYTAASGTLVWGDNDDANKTFQVPITNDSADEANETVQLALSNPTGGATLGSPSGATLTIQDNDDGGGGGSPGTLRLASAAASTSEGAGTVSLQVLREGGSTGAVSAHYATANGTAAAGSDFIAESGTVQFAAGDTTAKTIDVGLIDDGVEEGAETFSLALSAPAGGATLGAPASATVTVADDDLPTVCVEDANTLCLNNDRFRVRVVWTDFQDNTGPGFALPYTDDSGFFYFFGPENLEILIKVLNACDPFERYWVYFAVASNVAYTIEVVDVAGQQVKTYTNPAGVYAPATGDNNAFATCP